MPTITCSTKYGANKNLVYLYKISKGPYFLLLDHRSISYHFHDQERGAQNCCFCFQEIICTTGTFYTMVKILWHQNVSKTAAVISEHIVKASGQTSHVICLTSSKRRSLA